MLTTQFYDLVAKYFVALEEFERTKTTVTFVKVLELKRRILAEIDYMRQKRQQKLLPYNYNY